MASHQPTIHQQVAIGITSGLLVLTTFVVYIRLYIRCILLKAGSAGWDDLTVFIAWIMALGASIATYYEIASGLGRHVEELTPEQVHGFNLSLFVVIQFYCVGLNVVKLSFLAQFYRIIPDRIIRRICVCFAFFCFLWMIVQSILYSFSCVPIQFLVPVMSAVCIPTLSTWTAISIVNVITDAVIFCIPLKPLWALPLLKRQRYLLIGIFCFGFLICVISIIRIPTLRHGASSPDPSFTNVTTGLWSLAELETAILCTSLPVLRPLIARFIRGVSPPDANPNQLRAGPRPPEGNVHCIQPPDDSLFDTALSGSTLGTRSYLRTTATRDGDKTEGAILSAIPKTKVVEIKYRPRDEEKALDAIDFFHFPTLKAGTQGPRQIRPHDLRKDASLNSPWKATSIPIIPSSPQGSTQRLLHTPISPTSTHYSGNDVNELPNARIIDSISKPCDPLDHDMDSHQVFSSHTPNPKLEAVTGAICSKCSSELPSDQHCSPTLPSPREQAQDADAQSSFCREKTATHSTVQHLSSNAMVTQSTQTVVPWSSRPESRRSPSPQRSTDRAGPTPVKPGAIARARERAMQAIAEKTQGQVGEVHHGRARIVQVDSSQRRRAAIGLDEVLGLDVDSSPQRRFGLVPSRKEAAMAQDDGFNSPTSSAASQRAQGVRRALRPNEKQEDMICMADNVNGAMSASQPSPTTANGAREEIVPALSAAGRRTAGTSWLRLSAEFERQ